jgi:hypothetical protein
MRSRSQRPLLLFRATQNAVAALTPSAAPTARHDEPVERNRLISVRSIFFRGRPRIFPLARAFRSPARTLSAIRLRSSSATAPKTVKTSFPAGVDVSNCSDRLTNSIPSALNVSKARRRWLTDRANRSNLQQTTASKRLRCASPRSLLSCGRDSLAPEMPSSIYSCLIFQPRRLQYARSRIAKGIIDAARPIPRNRVEIR